MMTARSDSSVIPPVIRRPKPPHLQRRARVISAARLILPAAAAGLLTVLALWSHFGLDTSSFRLTMGSLDLNSLDTLAMSNAHFEGLDEEKRPFSVSAEKATQVDNSSDAIDLTALQADMTMKDGAWLSMTSDTGRLQRSKKLLDLTGQVNLFHDQGYELHTRDVHVNLADDSAVGNQPVAGQGPSGELTAEGLEVFDSGQRVVFLGKTHMLFYSDSQMSAVPKP
jgi:lipopolysaccharide export system protein LptC